MSRQACEATDSTKWAQTGKTRVFRTQHSGILLIMTESAHPALQLLLTAGLVIFWATPLAAWWVLSGHRDRNAQFWFTGTTLHGLVATFFVFGAFLPAWLKGPGTHLLALATVLLFLESMRREVSDRPPPLRIYGAVLIAHLLALSYLLVVNPDYVTAGTAWHLTIISLANVGLAVMTLRAKSLHGSRALGLVVLVIGVFVISNLSRLVQVALTGRMPQLLDYTLLSNLSLLINYLSPIFYSYGYWGFVSEKSRSRAQAAAEQALQARTSEALAQQKEALAQEALKHRTEVLDHMTHIGKIMQASALSATLAHEINQPLAAIQLNIDESLRWAQEFEVPSVLQRTLLSIKQDNLRAAQVVERVRTLFSRRPALVSLQEPHQVVRSVLAVLERRLTQAQVQVELNLTSEVSVPFGPGELEHVVMNLLDNAIDAVQYNTTDNRKLKVQTVTEGMNLCLSVSDNGPGVDPAICDRIFDLTQTHKPNGMGVGLWLARYIVERYRGDLFLDASHRQGARFVLRLPASFASPLHK